MAADDDGTSIVTWLDTVKKGYGGRFSACFEEVGCEDTVDLADLGDKELELLKTELESAGAKALHIKKILAAIEVAAAPSSNTRSKLDDARALDSEISGGSGSGSGCGSDGGGGGGGSGTGALVASKGREWRAQSKKAFACFLSHHKGSAAMEARFIKGELERLLGCRPNEIFLDSDDLRDLRQLLDHVRDSDCLVVLQSREVLQRPWCLLEINAAIEAGVPIVAINLMGKGYDFAEASQLCMHLDTKLDLYNMGALELIAQQGVDPLRVAHRLSMVVPNIISVPFDSCASRNIIQASLMDLIEVMSQSKAVEIQTTFDDWIKSRPPPAVPAITAAAGTIGQHGSNPDAHYEHGRPPPTAAVAAAAPAGGGGGGGGAVDGGGGSFFMVAPLAAGGKARIPSACPDLPAGFQVRATILDGIKKRMALDNSGGSGAGGSGAGGSGAGGSGDGGSGDGGSGDGGEGAIGGTDTALPFAAATTTIFGMGGSGKTVIGSALMRDAGVRGMFDVMIFLPIGQEPVLRDLQALAFRQLTGGRLDPKLTQDEAFEAVRAAAVESKMRVLLLIDDAWDAGQVKALSSCVVPDVQPASRVVVTTRVKGIVHGAHEFELGLLDAEDAAALILEVAGEEVPPPPAAAPPGSAASAASSGSSRFSPLMLEVVELCGRLPLVCSIAGGMLENHGGEVDEDFVALLKEDHREVLRTGEFGDELVDIEDRLITNSLRTFKGRDKELVKATFKFMAVFPEDVVVPMVVFDVMAPFLAGPGTKRPRVKVRGWLVALLRCSLLKGSVSTGLFMHDIVRHHAIISHQQGPEGQEDLRAKQETTARTLLAARGNVGDGRAKRQLVQYLKLHLWYHIRGALGIESTSAAPAAAAGAGCEGQKDGGEAGTGIATGNAKGQEAAADAVSAPAGGGAASASASSATAAAAAAAASVEAGPLWKHREMCLSFLKDAESFVGGALVLAAGIDASTAHATALGKKADVLLKLESVEWFDAVTQLFAAGRLTQDTEMKALELMQAVCEELPLDHAGLDTRMRRMKASCFSRLGVCYMMDEQKMIGHFMKGMGHPDCCIRYCAKASMQFGVMYDAVKWVQPEGGASKVPVEDWVKGAAAFEQFYQPDDIDKGGSDGLVDEVVAVLGEDYRIAKSMYLAANFYFCMDVFLVTKFQTLTERTRNKYLGPSGLESLRGWVRNYDPDKHYHMFKTMMDKIDFFICLIFSAPLAWHFCDIDQSMVAYFDKTCATWVSIFRANPRAVVISGHINEMQFGLWSVMQAGILLGRPRAVLDWLITLKICRNRQDLSGIIAFQAECWRAAPHYQSIIRKEALEAVIAMVMSITIILSTEGGKDGLSDDLRRQMADFIPSTDLLEQDCKQGLFFVGMIAGNNTPLTQAARLAELLGDDARARECAERALTCGVRQPPAIVDAHCILGRIKRRAGDEDGAQKHFSDCTDYSLDLQVNLGALLAGREAGGGAGEAMVDKALAAAGRSREDVSLILRQPTTGNPPVSLASLSKGPALAATGAVPAGEVSALPLAAGAGGGPAVDLPDPTIRSPRVAVLEPLPAA